MKIYGRISASLGTSTRRGQFKGDVHSILVFESPPLLRVGTRIRCGLPYRNGGQHYGDCGARIQASVTLSRLVTCLIVWLRLPMFLGTQKCTLSPAKDTEIQEPKHREREYALPRWLETFSFFKRFVVMVFQMLALLYVLATVIRLKPTLGPSESWLCSLFLTGSLDSQATALRLLVSVWQTNCVNQGIVSKRLA